MKTVFPIFLMACAGLMASVMTASAGPCTKQIAAFAQSVRAAGKNPDLGPTARQSLAADLGRQPTPNSVKQAEQQAQETFQRALARAKTLDKQGKPSCKQALTKAKNLFEVQ